MGSVASRSFAETEKAEREEKSKKHLDTGVLDKGEKSLELFPNCSDFQVSGRERYVRYVFICPQVGGNYCNANL